MNVRVEEELTRDALLQDLAFSGAAADAAMRSPQPPIPPKVLDWE